MHVHVHVHLLYPLLPGGGEGGRHSGGGGGGGGEREVRDEVREKQRHSGGK